MIELEFAELHGPIFLNGTNLGPKLIVGDGPGKRRDIKLFFDRDHRELHVHFKEKLGIVPRENVAMMVENCSSFKPPETVRRMVEAQKETFASQIASTPYEKVTAQVDSPHHHVFKGEGHGKTGRDK